MIVDGQPHALEGFFTKRRHMVVIAIAFMAGSA
jgi:hypothetical protein